VVFCYIDQTVKESDVITPIIALVVVVSLLGIFSDIAAWIKSKFK